MRVGYTFKNFNSLQISGSSSTRLDLLSTLMRGRSKEKEIKHIGNAHAQAQIMHICFKSCIDQLTFFSTSGWSLRASRRFSASDPTFSSVDTCSSL